MIGINTNLGSLIVQSNLKKSTNALNTAIERMTTGFKINGAKDNAANYAISNDMSIKISAYEVAEDNVAMGLDIVETASSSLALIEDRLARLRMLEEQAMNDTYGEESLEAINQECNSLVDEINRLYLNTEYNGINLFLEPQTNGKTSSEYYEINASKSTTFDQLGITSGSFTVYDKFGNKQADYSVTKDNNLEDFFNLLGKHNIKGSISGGVISLDSTDGSYIEGDLADALGISTGEVTIIESSTQSSNGAVTFTETIEATGGNTLQQLGIQGGSITVKDKNGNSVGSVNLSSSDTIDSMFSKLSAYGITGKIEDGVITLTSASGNYAEGALLNSMVIGTEAGANVTIKSAATMTSKLGDVYSGSSYNVTVVNQKTGAEEVFTLSKNDTFADMRDEFASRGMSLSINNGVVTLTSTDNSLIAKGSILNSFGMSEVTNGTYTVTTANSMTSPELNYTMTITTTTTETKTGGSFIQSVNSIDTTGLTSLSEVAITDYLAEGTYAIRTTEDLETLADIANNSKLNTTGMIDYYFVLANNIDLAESGYSVDTGKKWESIGKSLSPFVGTFDGNGYVISNLYGDSGLFNEIGTFDGSVDSVIKNLGLENVEISYTASSYQPIGGVVNDMNDKSSLYNCYVTGNIHGNRWVGGLVGQMSQNNYSDATTEIHFCYSSGVIQATDNYAGGLVGLAGSLINMSNSFSSAYVTGENNVGGLIGGIHSHIEGHNVNIEHVYSTGTVLGNTAIGGLFGSVTSGGALHGCEITFKNIYAEGTVLASRNGGGLIGYLSTASSFAQPIHFYTVHDLTTSDSKITGSLAGSYNSDIEGGADYYYTSHPDIEILGGENSQTCNFTVQYTSDKYPYLPYYTPTVNQVTVTTTVTTTSTAELSAATKLSDLGAGSGTLTLGSGAAINYSANDTVTDFINKLANYGIAAAVNNGKLSITQTNNAFIKSDSGQLFNKLGIDLSKSFSTSQKPLYANSSSNKLETESITTSKTNTQSDPLGSKQTATITGAATLNSIGINSDIKISVDGKTHNINVDSTSTIDEFITELKALGLNAGLTNGVLEISGKGDVQFQSPDVASAFQLGQVAHTEGKSKENTDSQKLTYEIQLTPPSMDDAYAPGKFTLQVGIDSSENSRIEISTALGLNQIEILRGIGLDDTDYLSVIDDMLNIVNAKQTEFGAVQNRLESALDEISIHYENLVSSRSTLRDADIAEVSSEYIREQILQQAAATLLATANQTPAIALQLL